MNQAEFWPLTGKSYGSLKNYERHPDSTPPDVIERLKSVAAERGLADWAVSLSSDDWRVRTVIYPITPARAITQPAPAPAPGDRRYHEMLDAILAAGDDLAVRTVSSALLLIYTWLSGRQATAPPARPKKAQNKAQKKA